MAFIGRLLNFWKKIWASLVPPHLVERILKFLDILEYLESWGHPLTPESNRIFSHILIPQFQFPKSPLTKTCLRVLHKLRIFTKLWYLWLEIKTEESQFLMRNVHGKLLTIHKARIKWKFFNWLLIHLHKILVHPTHNVIRLKQVEQAQTRCNKFNWK